MAEWPGIPWSTNGLASGSTLLEAVLSGLLEVIERDALLVAGPHPRPIELDGLPEGQCQQLVGRMLEAGLVPRIDDVTVDTATPVIRVVLSDTLHHSGVFHGYGSALGTEVAMVRALTEAAQSRSAMLAGVREDVFWSERRVTALLADGRLATVPDVPVHKEVVFEEAFTGSFEGDIGILVSRLRAAGLDRVIVVRHTDDDHPFQVVRVIVPGSLGLSMRGYDSAPGRLRERRAR
jgi:ribosomal protein S12 methylthiotransferase accessory factor